MRPRKVVANLNVADVQEAKAFYQDFLGLSVEEFSLGWVARFTSPDGEVSVQLVSGDATSRVDSDLSLMVDDVDAAYAEALAAGHEIVHPLTTEAWGPRRFFVRAPDGHVVNVVQHHG